MATYRLANEKGITRGWSRVSYRTTKAYAQDVANEHNEKILIWSDDDDDAAELDEILPSPKGQCLDQWSQSGVRYVCSLDRGHTEPHAASRPGLAVSP